MLQDSRSQWRMTVDLHPTATSHSICCAEYDKDLPFAPASFDLVILHQTLDDLITAQRGQGRTFAVVEFLLRVNKVLATGGVLAGAVCNRTGIRHNLSLLLRLLTRRLNNAPVATFSLKSSRETLERAGFGSIAVFNLLPNAESPLNLINTDAAISRLTFKKELESNRSVLSIRSYLARRLVAELALNRFLEQSIFFWGYKL
jgi:hypothetical protein